MQHTRQMAEALATHLHYKGGLYQLIGRAKLSTAAPDDPAYDMAVYLHLWPHDVQLWVRPWVEFNEKLPDGRHRFMPMYLDGFKRGFEGGQLVPISKKDD